METLDAYVGWLNRQASSTRLGALVAIALVPVALVAATAVFLPAAAPIGGALAGGGLFAALYGYAKAVLSQTRQDELDPKSRYPLNTRRAAAGVAMAVWVIILLLLGRFVPGPVLGTLNVFVFLCLYWLWRATPVEAAQVLAEYEAKQAAKAHEEEQAQWQADEDLGAYYDDGHRS